MENGQAFTLTNQTAANWTYVAILFELQKLHADENLSFHSEIVYISVYLCWTNI